MFSEITAQDNHGIVLYHPKIHIEDINWPQYRTKLLWYF